MPKQNMNLIYIKYTDAGKLTCEAKLPDVTNWYWDKRCLVIKYDKGKRQTTINKKYLIKVDVEEFPDRD